MRILVLHDPYKPIENGSVGGEDNLVQLEIEQLSHKGYEVFDGRSFDVGTRKNSTNCVLSHMDQRQKCCHL